MVDPVQVVPVAGGVVPVQPAPAPAAPAPAPAPAPLPAPLAATPAPAGAPPAGYNPDSGDAVVDLSVQNYTRAFGVSREVFESAVRPALEGADPNLLNIAELVRTVGAEAAASAAELVRGLLTHVKAKQDTVSQQLHSIAGSKENWAASVQFFNQSQPDFVKAQYSDLLNSGDPARIEYAAKQIVQLAQQSGVSAPGFSVTPGSGLPGTTAALSAGEFSEKFAELRKRAGNRSLESGPFASEYQNLLAQREAGRKLGK